MADARAGSIGITAIGSAFVVIVSCVAVAALVGRIVATVRRALVEIVAPSG